MKQVYVPAAVRRLSIPLPSCRRRFVPRSRAAAAVGTAQEYDEQRITAGSRPAVLQADADRLLRSGC